MVQRPHQRLHENAEYEMNSRAATLGLAESHVWDRVCVYTRIRSGAEVVVDSALKRVSERPQTALSETYADSLEG